MDLKQGLVRSSPPLVTTIINNWAKILDDGGPTTVAPHPSYCREGAVSWPPWINSHAITKR